jgi:colicin import membrane protein
VTPLERDLADPFRIGTQMLCTTGPDGKRGYREVPMALEDFLHPLEEDRFTHCKMHADTVLRLWEAVEARFADRPDVQVFARHRIDWQVPGILPHGPDIAVFDNSSRHWNPHRNTLPVREMGYNPLAVIEVTEGPTRDIDFAEKFTEYCAAGVPVYVIVDAAGPAGADRVLAFRRGSSGFVPIEARGELGVFVPGIDLWLSWANDRIAVATQDGRVIPSAAEIATLYAGLPARIARGLTQVGPALSESTRKYDAERQRADAAAWRADALQAELAALRAKFNADGE